MPTPFPGMDPYLERPGLWQEVHAGLIVGIQQFLNPLVAPRYRVAIESRTYLALSTPETLVGEPDVLVVPSGSSAAAPVISGGGAVPQVAELPLPFEVVERYLEIQDAGSGEVVTVMELLSPTNKSSYQGRRRYERKRLQILASLTHFIEIDLLRAGQPFPFHLVEGEKRSDYRILVSRAQHRPRADVYLFSLREPIPDIPVPLRPHEDEPLLQLNQILHMLYDRARYDLAVDYQEPSEPPLSEKDACWFAQLLEMGRSD